MSLLLDTHSFIWFVNGDVQLSNDARQAIENPAQTKYISTASIWEMAIKFSIGKLEVYDSFEQVLSDVRTNGINLLQIEASHHLVVSGLPFHHRDPFDRMIIAQAKVEGFTVVVNQDLDFSYLFLLS